ncbi:MAG TPA: hypothetical protein VE093_42920 [Polyangiaceae bacterium]|jgi:hypothetical protein|nr:hypothetical protein [Polyangiaceae bacterium]
MAIKDYRRRLTQEVEAAKERKDEPQWGAVLESAGVLDALGRAQGGEADHAALRAMATGPSPHPDPAVRAAALGKAASRTPAAEAHHAPLQCLLANSEHWRVRLGALGILKQLAISSPTFAEWRADYLSALRAAIDVPELRLPAFATLLQMGDRSAREMLLDGLRVPERALVPVADALNFLSYDPHGDVRDIAREVVDTSRDDERAVEAALRHLAGDPTSVNRLKGVIEDPSRSVRTRKAAATALNTLGPEHLASVQRREALALDADRHVRALAFKAAPAVQPELDDPLDQHIAGLLSRRAQK